jgi:hypothetical protein
MVYWKIPPSIPSVVLLLYGPPTHAKAVDWENMAARARQALNFFMAISSNVAIGGVSGK